MAKTKNLTGKRFVKGIIALVCGAAAVFGGSTAAGAKGPVSATITGPGIEQPIELVEGINNKKVYRLMEQTLVWFGPGAPLENIPLAGQLGQAYTIVWVNGGPPGTSVASRTIRQLIYLDAPGGPLIHTPEQVGLENWGAGVIGWFQAPPGLRDALADLGVPLTPPPAMIETGFSRQSVEGLEGVRKYADVFWYLGVVGTLLMLAVVGVRTRRREVDIHAP